MIKVKVNNAIVNTTKDVLNELNDGGYYADIDDSNDSGVDFEVYFDCEVIGEKITHTLEPDGKFVSITKYDLIDADDAYLIVFNFQNCELPEELSDRYGKGTDIDIYYENNKPLESPNKYEDDDEIEEELSSDYMLYRFEDIDLKQIINSGELP